MTSANHQSSSDSVEQALIVTVPLSGGDWEDDEQVERLFKLEEEVMKAIEDSGAGEYDGNEIGEGTFTMYAYGPSASKLFGVAMPILAKYQLPSGSQAMMRYGRPGAEEDRIPISNGAAN